VSKIDYSPGENFVSKLQPAVLDKLRQYDTPTICNVIELFNVRPHTSGYMDRSIRAVFPEMPPVVGFASTVTCRTAVLPRAKDAYTALPDQIARFAELSGPPVLVFQDLDGLHAAATFGEVMCTTYKTFGAVGLITNGPGRDLDQVHALGFPVFTDGAVVSHGHIHLLDIHIPVLVGGLTVYSDDLIHADVNGVTTIPVEIAADVADACADYVAAEQVILDALRSPGATLDRLRAAIIKKDALMGILSQRIKSS
jgi:regulator of RNase E activity RraA